MKKLLVLATAVAMLSSFAFAEKSVEAGLKGGLNINAGSKFTFDHADDIVDKYNVFAGGDIGLFGHFGLINLGPGTLALQPEFVVSFDNGVSADYKVGSAKITYTSIDIPVLVTYDIPVASLSIRPMLGLQFGIPVGEFGADGEGDVKGFAVGFVGGCGVAFPLGPVVLGGDIRYNIDFNSIKNKDDDDVIQRGALGIQLSVAYKIK